MVGSVNNRVRPLGTGNGGSPPTVTAGGKGGLGNRTDGNTGGNGTGSNSGNSSNGTGSNETGGNGARGFPIYFTKFLQDLQSAREEKQRLGTGGNGTGGNGTGSDVAEVQIYFTKFLQDLQSAREEKQRLEKCVEDAKKEVHRLEKGVENARSVKAKMDRVSMGRVKDVNQDLSALPPPELQQPCHRLRRGRGRTPFLSIHRFRHFPRRRGFRIHNMLVVIRFLGPRQAPPP
ncbi:hypothetical protein HK102_008804, partial [Quaeritorhiza haematococci]